MRLKDVLISIFTLALVSSLVVLWLSPAGLTRVPSLTLLTIQGERLAIPDSEGRPQLIVFWATSCRNCISEIPGLVDLYRELGPHGLEIIGVAMQYDRPDQVIAVTKSRNISYPIALDIEGSSAQAFGDVHLTPTSFLVAADGRIVHQTVGKINMHEMRTMIVALLEQKKLAHADSGEQGHHAVD